MVMVGFDMCILWNLKCTANGSREAEGAGLYAHSFRKSINFIVFSGKLCYYVRIR